MLGRIGLGPNRNCLGHRRYRTVVSRINVRIGCPSVEPGPEKRCNGEQARQMCPEMNLQDIGIAVFI